MIKRLFLPFIMLFLASCAGKPELAESTFVPPEDCPRLYVILPGNFIIDLAAGSEVILNPDIHEFAAFCDAKKAEEAMKLAIKDGRLSVNEEWRVYALAGNGAELAKQCNGNNLCLGQQAMVEEWVDSKAF